MIQEWTFSFGNNAFLYQVISITNNSGNTRISEHTHTHTHAQFLFFPLFCIYNFENVKGEASTDKHLCRLSEWEIILEI